MTRKNAVSRPYPPDYVSAATLAYRLDVSTDTIDDWVRSGHLPQPVQVGTQRRWLWDEVRAFIDIRNGRGAPVPDSLDSGEDQFAKGIARAKGQATHA